MFSSGSYHYTKERRNFGRQFFLTDRYFCLANYPSDKGQFSEYIRRNPITVSTQLSVSQSGQEANTENKTLESIGICHKEGGWPKDVNIADEEQVARYRKRIEREDQYEIQLRRILVPTLAAMNQNSAVNVHEDYFKVETQTSERKSTSTKTIFHFSDPAESYRSASNINFSPNGADMVVAYADMTYPFDRKSSTSSYIWNIEYSQNPKLELVPISAVPLTQLQYNGRDEFIVAGGLSSGCVCVYDTRIGGKAQGESQMEFSHQEPVSSLQWIQSKTNTAFFTGSCDGHVMWWDIRSLKQPSDLVQCGSGCTILEFNYSMPMSFLVGTDDGLLWYGNRRGATIEERLPFKNQCHEWGIRSIERNPIAEKNILTVSGFELKIWSEDVRESPLYFRAVDDIPFTCGAWNPKRGSLLLLGRADGGLSLCDLLADQKNNIESIRPHNTPMNDIRCHANGKLFACSYASGDVFLLEFPEHLTTITREERGSMSEMFEREMNRVKYFTAKIRERNLSLRKNIATDDNEENDDEETEVFDPKKALDENEKDFCDKTLQ